MEANRLKFECQVRLIASLGEFVGPVPPAFGSHREHFIVTLQRIAADLEEFKRGSLRALGDWLLERRRRGCPSQADIEQFKDLLEKLVPGRDYMMVCSALTGSSEFLSEKLSRASVLSIASEEKKLPGEPRDPAADRLVSEAYRRLGFDKLQELAGRQPADAVLARGREQVAEYCALYRLPLSAEDTLPPFSLSRIDAVVGACFRLLAAVNAAGRGG